MRHAMGRRTICVLGIIVWGLSAQAQVAQISMQHTAGDPTVQGGEYAIAVRVAQNSTVVGFYAVRFVFPLDTQFVSAADGGDGMGEDPIPFVPNAREIALGCQANASQFRTGVLFVARFRPLAAPPASYTIRLEAHGGNALFTSDLVPIASNLNSPNARITLVLGASTPTFTPAASASPATSTPTHTHTSTPTASHTPTASPTDTPTPTLTPTPTPTPTASDTPQLGDLQPDGLLNSRDLLVFSRYWRTDSSSGDETAFRANLAPGDAMIDADDLLRLLEALHR